MKNKIFKFIFSGVLVLFVMGISIACDPLGVEPTTQVDETRFWLNPQLARSYVNDFYFWGATGSGDTFQSEQWSDNCQGNIEQDWADYRQYSFNYRRYDESGGLGLAPWASAYRRIYKVNLGLEKLTG